MTENKPQGIDVQTTVQKREEKLNNGIELNKETILYAECNGRQLTDLIKKSDKDTKNTDLFPHVRRSDNVAAFNIENLIEVLENIDKSLDANYVKVRLSNEKPIQFLTKDNDSKVLGTVAPLNENGIYRGRLRPIESNLIGYSVECEHDDCKWSGDRYRAEFVAKKAAEDHKYFTGHSPTVKNYYGEEVDWE